MSECPNCCLRHIQSLTLTDVFSGVSYDEFTCWHCNYTWYIYPHFQVFSEVVNQPQSNPDFDDIPF